MLRNEPEAAVRPKVPSSRRDFQTNALPGLKPGVTINIALQASCMLFPVMLPSNRQKGMGREVLQQPFLCLFANFKEATCIKLATNH